MIISRKGSLTLSINAIVIFVLALTLLGLGIPFITGVFNKAEDLTISSFDRILAREEEAFMESCADIEIAGEPGGSNSFESESCNIVGGETVEQKCSDVSILSFESEQVLEKGKTPVDIKIRVKNTAQNTVYAYRIKVYGECDFQQQTFSFDTTKTLRVDVQG